MVTSPHLTSPPSCGIAGLPWEERIGGEKNKLVAIIEA